MPRASVNTASWLPASAVSVKTSTTSQRSVGTAAPYPDPVHIVSAVPRAIVVSDLTKSYGNVQALRGVSFDVAEGEVFGLLGPNGAGKTTTVEILEGYRRQDGGNATVLGLDPRQRPACAARARRRRPPAVRAEPLLTVREAHRMFAGYFANPRDVDEVIELVGLGRSMTLA